MRNLPIAAVALTAACAPAVPSGPEALDGLWSRSDVACAAGAGVRFEPEAVRVFYGRHDDVLFPAPRYRVERRGDVLRVSVRYETSPAEGEKARERVLILERAGDALHPVSHDFADRSTGAVTVRLDGAEDLAMHFTLSRCSDAADKEKARDPEIPRQVSGP